MEERSTSHEAGSSTPSRYSLANLLTPVQSPKSHANGDDSPGPVAKATKEIEHISIASSSVDDDVVMLDVRRRPASDSTGGKLKSPIDNPSPSLPIANGTGDGIANADKDVEANGKNDSDDDNYDDAEDKNFGEDGEEDVGDEDDDDEDSEDEDEEDDEDDEDEDDSEGEGEGDRSDMEGVEAVVGEESIAKGENGEAGDVTMTQDSSALRAGSNGASTSQNGAVKKKIVKRRSPSVEVDPLPTGPPPRPTVRLKFDLRKQEDDAYMINIPDEIYSTLKEQDEQHPWALWYETTGPAELENGEGVEEDGEEDVADEGIDRSELGGLARLLEKYPAHMPGGSSKSKKKSDMVYEIGDYDVRDPFVDDSELNVDEPTYTAKPTADGFFVVEGEIELEEVERNKIIQSGQDALALANRRGQIPTGFGQSDGDAGGAGALYLELGPKTPSVVIVNTMLSRHADKFGIMPPSSSSSASASQTTNVNANATTGDSSTGDTKTESNEAKEGDAALDRQLSDRPLPLFQPIQPVKYPVERVPRRLEDEFIKLRQMAAKESWLKKSKFPPDLREPLGVACRIAIALNELNDNFFNWLPQIFPYNRHTLHKFVRRQMYEQHVGYMKQLWELNESGFKRQIEELVPRLQKEYDEAMVAWQARGSREATPVAAVDGDAVATPTGTPSNGAAVEKEADGGGAGELGEGEDEPPVNKNAKPVRRWQWTEPFRETLFTIITIDNAITELRQSKNDLENVQEKISVINQRKDIYKRLIELWPEKTWTTTTALSNQHGLYKRRVEKYAQMLHEDSQGLVV